MIPNGALNCTTKWGRSVRAAQVCYHFRKLNSPVYEMKPYLQESLKIKPDWNNRRPDHKISFVTVHNECWGAGGGGGENYWCWTFGSIFRSKPPTLQKQISGRHPTLFNLKGQKSISIQISSLTKCTDCFTWINTQPPCSRKSQFCLVIKYLPGCLVLMRTWTQNQYDSTAPQNIYPSGLKHIEYKGDKTESWRKPREMAHLPPGLPPTTELSNWWPPGAKL